MTEIWKATILNDIDRYYRLAFCYVKNPEDTKDIIQESLYKALKAKGKIKDAGAVSTWFYKIVVNTAIDYIRKNRKDLYLAEDQWEAIPDLTGQPDYGLQEALDCLPFKYRTVVILRYYEDLKISDIARILDENENTVKTRLYSALKKLKIRLENEEEF